MGLIGLFIRKILDDRPPDILRYAGKFFDRAELRDVVTESIEKEKENEARNQQSFKQELGLRKCKVHVPLVFSQFTTQRVIVTEWIDGIKLADAPKDQIRSLIPDGVELFLIQLLDMGFFHADPHPGNLYVTKDGRLCLLDFGLCAEIDEKAKKGNDYGNLSFAHW